MERLIPIRKAAKLWMRDRRTLKKWADAGIIMCNRKPFGSTGKLLYYVETPADNYNRLYNR